MFLSISDFSPSQFHVRTPCSVLVSISFVGGQTSVPASAYNVRNFSLFLTRPFVGILGALTCSFRRLKWVFLRRRILPTRPQRHLYCCQLLLSRNYRLWNPFQVSLRALPRSLTPQRFCGFFSRGMYTRREKLVGRMNEGNHAVCVVVAAGVKRRGLLRMRAMDLLRCEVYACVTRLLTDMLSLSEHKLCFLEQKLARRSRNLPSSCLGSAGKGGIVMTKTRRMREIISRRLLLV